MPTNRTIISDSYVKPSDSCSIPCATTTRTCVGGSYIRPSACYPSWYQPSTWWSPRMVEPIIIAPEPSVVVRSSRVGSVADAVGTLFLATIVIGTVAVALFVPSCQIEEVCRPIGWGLDKCHLEKVCHTFF